MATARTYHCANCGAPTAERTRQCQFCSAPVATVRCGHCYHMNIPEAAHCSGCGRQLGLEPLGEPGTLQCPACSVVMQAFLSEHGTLLDCPQCGGQFIEHQLLRDLLERREVLGEAAPRKVPKQNPLKSPVRYLPCPCCQELMHRRNFGKRSGIILDVCVVHGMWFDMGELPAVLAFAESGGLARARREQSEADRSRKERVATAAAAAPPVDSLIEISAFTWAADAGFELLKSVLEILD